MIETPPITQIPQKSLQLLWRLLRLWLPPHLRKEDGQVPFGVWLGHARVGGSLVIQGFSKKGCLSDYGKTHVNYLLRCGEYYGL